MSEQNFTANQLTMILIDGVMDQNGRGTDVAADCQNV